MVERIRLWKIERDELVELEKNSPKTERDLEEWIERDLSIISPNLLLIGRQVSTDFGGAIDLFCVDGQGDVVVVELKRDRTPRDVVAQILDYTAWISEISAERISEVAREYLRKNLEDAFREKFNSELPDLNLSQKMIIVATEADETTERIVKYLSKNYGVNINIVKFDFFKDGEGDKYLVRSFVLDPQEVEERTTRRRKIDRSQFLVPCNQNERRLFEKLFEMVDRLELSLSWGSTGCSIIVPRNNVRICYCYSPLASFGPALYVALNEVKQKVGIGVDKYSDELRSTGLFIQAGESLKIDFTKELKDENILQIVEVFENFIKDIMGYGERSHE